jgi:hypothetical protein
LVFFCSFFASWSQCCVIDIIFDLGFMSSFHVACSVCLQAMSANTLVWSQLSWHYQGLVCLIVLSFWLQSTIYLPKCKLAPTHACELTCNSTKLLAFKVALRCKIFCLFDLKFPILAFEFAPNLEAINVFSNERHWTFSWSQSFLAMEDGALHVHGFRDEMKSYYDYHISLWNDSLSPPKEHGLKNIARFYHCSLFLTFSLSLSLKIMLACDKGETCYLSTHQQHHIWTMLS